MASPVPRIAGHAMARSRKFRNVADNSQVCARSNVATGRCCCARVRELMDTDPVRVTPDTDLTDIALLMADYNLYAMPVVDDTDVCSASSPSTTFSRPPFPKTGAAASPHPARSGNPHQAPTPPRTSPTAAAHRDERRRKPLHPKGNRVRTTACPAGRRHRAAIRSPTTSRGAGQLGTTNSPAPEQLSGTTKTPSTPSTPPAQDTPAPQKSRTTPTSRPSAVLDSAHLGDIEGAFGRIDITETDRPRTLRTRLLPLAAIVGPGLIVMVGDNDAGGVATYAQAGQNYGYGLLWVLLLLIPVLIVNQEMVVRMCAVTGGGLARLINERFGRGWGWFSVGDLRGDHGGGVSVVLPAVRHPRGNSATPAPSRTCSGRPTVCWGRSSRSCCWMRPSSAPPRSPCPPVTHSVMCSASNTPCTAASKMRNSSISPTLRWSPWPLRSC